MEGFILLLIVAAIVIAVIFFIKDTHIHIHNHPDPETKESLNSIINKLNLIMGNQQEQFDLLMGRLDTVTNDVAADYKKLLDEVQDKISPESFARGEANVAKLEALGASVDNPVPVEPTPP